ncbi:MAG: DUF1828 domain-containing protein [Bacteroidetes bacterium]|nr:DUF1828 domain-containing protein [Bacteroidota bacterium]
MDIALVEKSFQEKLSKDIRVQQQGINRFLVFTPFKFDDGDHFVIVLRLDSDRAILTDEAHTYMHLSYWFDQQDLLMDRFESVIENTLSDYGIQDIDGELILEVPDHQYGDALYTFVQVLLKLSDASYLVYEYVRSQFMDDFRSLIIETVAPNRFIFDWNDPTLDPDKKYMIDCRVHDSADPLFVMGLNSDSKTRDATIALLQYQQWGIPFQSMAIFHDQELINPKVLARFTDVCDKHFSIITMNQDDIQSYLSARIELRID